MNNIIFIEGVSGVGKTTTTTLLRDKIRDMGYKTDCCIEGDNDNPLDPFKGTYPPAIPLTAFSEIYLQCWRNFIKSNYEKDSILILDGTLLHHQINDMIREYDASDEVIADHLSKLICVIQQLNPIIFYLSSHDVGQCLAKARKNRSQSIPAKEQIAFWENRKRVDLYILDKLSVESHILNIDKGWEIILETMTFMIMKGV